VQRLLSIQLVEPARQPASTPKTPDDLKRYACIRFRKARGMMFCGAFARRIRQITVDVPGALTLDHGELMAGAGAADEGLGTAYIPRTLGSTMDRVRRSRDHAG
jgi:hypothetical protein